MKTVKTFIKQYAWYFAVLGMYILTCGILVAVEFWLYAHAIKTAWLHILLFPALSALMWFIREDNGDKPKPSPKRQKINNAVSVALVLVCSACIAVYGWQQPYDLRVWLYFGFLATTGIVLLVKKIRPPWLDTHSICKWAAAVFAGILAVAGMYLICLRPATVAQARQDIHQQGYTAVAIKGHYQSGQLTSVLQADTNDALGYYLFSAQKNGEEYGVLYSVHGRRVAAAVDTDENGYVAFLLQYS